MPRRITPAIIVSSAFSSRISRSSYPCRLGLPVSGPRPGYSSWARRQRYRQFQPWLVPHHQGPCLRRGLVFFLCNDLGFVRGALGFSCRHLAVVFPKPICRINPHRGPGAIRRPSTSTFSPVFTLLGLHSCRAPWQTRYRGWRAASRCPWRSACGRSRWRSPRLAANRRSRRRDHRARVRLACDVHRHIEIDLLAPGQHRRRNRQRRRNSLGGRRVEQFSLERERAEIEADAGHERLPWHCVWPSLRPCAAR